MASSYFVDAGLAGEGAGDGVFDECGSVLGSLSAALGEVADLIGDDGEAHACFAGTSGLYSRVEGEDVGLEGDLVDDLDDLGDLDGGRCDAFHGGEHLGERAVSLGDVVLRVGDDAGGGLGVVGVAAGHGADLLGGDGGLFDGGGLLGGASSARERLEDETWIAAAAI